MSQQNSSPLVDVYAEVSALVDRLHDTEQRLEELTGGEVDTVADASGRTFLLRRAQEQLRHADASRQAIILNALPAHVAVIDSQGAVVSVNDAWRRVASANMLQRPQIGIGENYLQICDTAPPCDSFNPKVVAEGIRSVLGGALKNFSIEYPCHSPAEQRWFSLTVTPLGDDRPTGAVTMHLDISERKRAEESLWRFAAAMNATSDAIYLVDRASMCFVHVNDAACRMQGLTREELLSLGPAKVLSTSRAKLELTYDAVIASGAADPLELPRQRTDGSTVWVEIRRHAQRSGNRWMIVTLARDVTERKAAEDKIRRLNRVHTVLSDINALIVRVRNRDDLFQEACRIAVEDGGFRLSWIGVVDRNAMTVKPVASAGADDGFIDQVRSRLSLRDDAPAGLGAPAIAVREKAAVVVNDVAADPRVRFKEAHAARGMRSFVSLPLLVGDEPVAVFHLHAAEAGFFDEAEMKLLRDLASNISFAIDHIDKQERLDYLAYYDALTGLANRNLFLERLAQYMRSAAGSGNKLAVFLIDLERFKNINDSFGQAAGDALLRQVAQWLTRNAGDASLLARIGADHFAAVLPEVQPDGDVAPFVENTIGALLDHPFRLDDAVFRVAAKTGVAVFPGDGTDADTLLKHAEAALKKAKASGDRYLFYTHKMTEAVAGRVTLENQLRHALDNNEFVLHYQPKINLESGKLTSAEALIRWNDPRTGLVSPGRFIPVLEETGLIFEVGRWALRKAIEDYLLWRNAGLPAVRIAVNVSPLQLRHRGFVAEIEEAIGIDPCAPGGLELEITESMIMGDVRHNVASLGAIRAMGVTIAIDDFGTGFSSLSYLAKLPVDTLKIDRSFVVDMTSGPQGLALVSTIINLAHSLKLNVVAEGVETEEQSRLLRLLKCDEMQGFLFSKPVPIEIFETRFLAPPAALACALAALA
jgi:diguanylate cyclase (GGDEF)-like protein/PAS domain S-box-containing protein